MTPLYTRLTPYFTEAGAHSDWFAKLYTVFGRSNFKANISSLLKLPLTKQEHLQLQQSRQHVTRVWSRPRRQLLYPSPHRTPARYRGARKIHPISRFRSSPTPPLLQTLLQNLPTNYAIQRKDELEYWLTEHLRLNGLYWGLTALHLMGRPDALPRDETIEFVLSCQGDSGGFGAAPGHDVHLLYTVSAVQILAMVDALDVLEERGWGGGKMGVGKCMCDFSFLYMVGLLLYLGRGGESERMEC